VAAPLVVIAGLVAGLGWLYVLRGLHWFSGGPRVSDALPLLQLAGFDRQPVLRVIVAWALAGLVVGYALRGMHPLARALLAAVLGCALLWLASEASFALARNYPFSEIVSHRAPRAGPWLEAFVFAAASALPGAFSRRQARPRRSALVTTPPARDRHPILGRRQRGHAPEHGGDRH
jgi:hypothetical protein